MYDSVQRRPRSSTSGHVCHSISCNWVHVNGMYLCMDTGNLHECCTMACQDKVAISGSSGVGGNRQQLHFQCSKTGRTIDTQTRYRLTQSTSSPEDELLPSSMTATRVSPIDILHRHMRDTTSSQTHHKLPLASTTIHASLPTTESIVVERPPEYHIDKVMNGEIDLCSPDKKWKKYYEKHCMFTK